MVVEQQACVDEPSVSTERIVLAEESITVEKSVVSTDDSHASGGDQPSMNVESSEKETVGSTDESVLSDESIISTADLRDVFNRLEVIVQKLARGGAVW